MSVPLEALLWDDPELALAHADMNAWAEAHPCACDALCVCDSETVLRRCGSCSRLVDAEFTVCPYCGDMTGAN